MVIKKVNGTYIKAQGTGWTQELEDSCYEFGWAFELYLSPKMPWETVIQHINNNIGLKLDSLLLWCKYMIINGYLVKELFLAINGSKLSNDIKKQMVSRVLVEGVFL